jgi:hypothetical protein
VLLQRLPAGEALVDPVPVLDRVLAELPAEVGLASLDPGREVDQPFVRILDDRAQRVDRVHAAGDTRQRFTDSLVELRQLARVDTGAVAGDPGDDPGPRRL